MNFLKILIVVLCLAGGACGQGYHEGDPIIEETLPPTIPEKVQKLPLVDKSETTHFETARGDGDKEVASTGREGLSASSFEQHTFLKKEFKNLYSSQFSEPQNILEKGESYFPLLFFIFKNLETIPLVLNLPSARISGVTDLILKVSSAEQTTYLPESGNCQASASTINLNGHYTHDFFLMPLTKQEKVGKFTNEPLRLEITPGETAGLVLYAPPEVAADLVLARPGSLESTHLTTSCFLGCRSPKTFVSWLSEIKIFRSYHGVPEEWNGMIERCRGCDGRPSENCSHCIGGIRVWRRDGRWQGAQLPDFCQEAWYNDFQYRDISVGRDFGGFTLSAKENEVLGTLSIKDGGSENTNNSTKIQLLPEQFLLVAP